MGYRVTKVFTLIICERMIAFSKLVGSLIQRERQKCKIAKEKRGRNYVGF